MPFCSTTFLHFSGNLKIPSFQNLSGFLAKNFSKWFFISTKELKLFPLREFYTTTFVELSKIHEAAHCPNETRRPSDSLFLDVFVQLLSSIRLIGNNISLNLSSHCLVKAHNTGSLFNPTRHRAWPSLDEDRLLGWLKMIHSAFPKIFFTQHYCENDPFFIPRHYLLQKCLLVAFIERIANGNAIHQIFLR